MFAEQAFPDPSLATLADTQRYIACALVCQMQRAFMADDFFTNIVNKFSERYPLLKTLMLE